MNLRYQILLPMSLVLIATLASVSAINAWLSSRQVLSQIETRLDRAAETLSKGSFPLESRVLAQASQLSGAKFVVTYTDNRVKAKSDRALELPESPAEVAAESASLSRTVNVAGVDYFYTAVPLDRRPTGGELMRLHVFYPQQAYAAARNAAVFPPLYVGGAGLVLLVLVTVVIAGQTTRPLEQLRTQVEQIARGDFQPLPPVRRKDEIGDLARSINRMTEMLARYENEVRRSERLRTLGQLGGGIAHQIRNAATGCRMAVDLHRTECNGTDDENLDVAVRQLTLMERYLKRFLTLGKPSASVFEPIELAPVIEAVIPMVTPLARHVNVDIKFQPPAESAVVNGSSEDLEQLLINLIVNGIEAIAEAKGEPDPSLAREVELCLNIVTGHARVTITDTGPGPSIDGDLLFEPLVSEKADGVGLGLSVAKQIIEEHNGELRWERIEGKTKFEIQLPLCS